MSNIMETPPLQYGFVENLNLVAQHIRLVDETIYEHINIYIAGSRAWAIASDEPDPILYPGEQSSKTNAGFSAISAAESLSSAAAALLSEQNSAASETAAGISEVNAEASYQNALLVEADVTAEGDAQVLLVQTEGTTQVGNVSDEGDAQVLLVQTEGAVQVGLAEDQVDLAEAQVVLATAEASTATAQAVIATDAAQEIKDVGVVSPVTSVPLLPNNETGIPTVSYDSLTGLFTYGIPVGKTGEAAQVVTPVGSATVAELDALGADPISGAAYWMTDTGTVTYGDPDCVVNEINEILVWVADGYFFNIGKLETGNNWDQMIGVTVNSAAPQVGDDLARAGTSYTKTEQNAIDLVQTDAITLNTAKVGITTTQASDITANNAKVTYDDAAVVAQNTLDAAAAQTDAASAQGTADGAQSAADTAQGTADGAVSANGIQDTAIALNTAKTGVTDEVHSTIGEPGAAAILNMVSITEAEYDLLTPVATTVYMIVG